MPKQKKQRFKKGDPWVNIPDAKPEPRYQCFKGSTFGPAGPCKIFNEDEREYWIKENPRLAYKKSWRNRVSTAK
jgi:hypothetical protein